MKIALVHDVALPVSAYGGTERVIWWLAKGLKEAGHDVILVCRPASHCPFAEVEAYRGDVPPDELAPTADVLHFFYTPCVPVSRPHLVTIEGNGKEGEVFSPNTVFVSRNHAERHGAKIFVYNGIDPDEYSASAQRDPYFIFLGKASWNVKNVKGAQKIARRAHRPLQILGGRRWFFPKWRGVWWRGMVGGSAKRDILARSSGLLFPVLWHEPFGLAVVETLISGAPVIATPFGSLPELVPPDVGLLSDRESDLVAAVRGADHFSRARCREWAHDRFHYRKMVESYVALYERVGTGQALHTEAPRTKVLPGPLFLKS